MLLLATLASVGTLMQVIAARSPPFVAYFKGDCPPDWAVYAPAGGRLLVPVNSASDAGVSVGTAQINLSDLPEHSHEALGTFGLKDGGGPVSLAGSSSLLLLQSLTVSAFLSGKTLGLPLSQVATCYLPSPSTTLATYTLPRGAFSFFDTTAAACPSGWGGRDDLAPSYRIVVPNSASCTTAEGPGIQVGSALGSHTHSASVISSTPSDVNFFSAVEGGTNIAAPTLDVRVSLTTSTTDMNIPYLSLLRCYNSFDESPGESPPNVLVFATNCESLVDNNPAAQWIPFHDFDGTFLVSSPVNGAPFAPLFNNRPKIPVGSNTPSFSHTHSVASPGGPQGTCQSYSLVPGGVYFFPSLFFPIASHSTLFPSTNSQTITPTHSAAAHQYPLTPPAQILGLHQTWTFHLFSFSFVFASLYQRRLIPQRPLSLPHLPPLPLLRNLLAARRLQVLMWLWQWQLHFLKIQQQLRH